MRDVFRIYPHSSRFTKKHMRKPSMPMQKSCSLRSMFFLTYRSLCGCPNPLNKSLRLPHLDGYVTHYVLFVKFFLEIYPLCAQFAKKTKAITEIVLLQIDAGNRLLFFLTLLSLSGYPNLPSKYIITNHQINFTQNFFR